MALNEAQVQEKEVQNKMVVFQEEHSALKETIEYIEITDEAMFKVAEDIRVDIENFLTGIDAFFDDIIKAAHQTHKLALARKGSVYNPAKILKDALVEKIDGWINKKKQAEAVALAIEESKNKQAIEEMNQAVRESEEAGDTEAAQNFTEQVREVFALQPAEQDPHWKPSKTTPVKDVDVEILKPLAFMRYLVGEEGADLDGALLIEWKMGSLKKMIMDNPDREWPSGPEGCLKITTLYRSRLNKGLKSDGR